LEDCSVSWLYGQTWLWYLIAFLVGLLLAWLVFVRPQQRRLKALLARSPTATPPAGGANAPAGRRATQAVAVEERTEAIPRPGVALAGAVAAGARHDGAPKGTDPPTESIPVIDPAGNAPTESIPVVDAAADSPTDVFPAVDPALSTLDTARVTAADAATPPPGMAAVPAADDTPTPPEGIPVATATADDQPEADLIPDEPVPDSAGAEEPTSDAPPADGLTPDEPFRDGPATAMPPSGSPSGSPSQPAAVEAAEDSTTTARLVPGRDQAPPGEAAP
jgi:hypothetical protein